jgi:hypothetical protein
MKDRRSWCILRLLGFMALTLLVLSCANPLSSAPSSSSASADTEKGSLTITVANNIARTLVPGISMTALSYTVVGVGPAGSGATFNKPITNNQITVTSLVPGNWTITVNAWNAANGTGTNIGVGTASVTIAAGQSSAAVITVAPLPGNGTLSLSTSWSGFSVSSICAQLKNTVSGNKTNLTFTVNSSNNTATMPVASTAAGYYTLTLQLLNGSSQVVMGTVDAVRIVTGQQTTGSYAFNATTGQVTVVMTPTPNNPIVLGGITGIPTTTITPSTDFTAGVVATDSTANATYTWYLNGVLLDSDNQSTPTTTSSAYHIGALALSPGYYRLDVIAVTADGTRAGSQTTSFLVSPVPPYIAGLAISDASGASLYEFVFVSTSNNGGEPISNAMVLLNGTLLTYNDDGGPGSPNGTYQGSVNIAAGASVTLTVIANGGTYTATGKMNTTFPNITSPTSGANWSVAYSQTIKFTPGAPTTGAYYFAGVQDTTSQWVWPTSNGPNFTSMSGVTSPISVAVPAGCLSSGNSYVAVAGMMNGAITGGQNGLTVTGGITIANAQSGSVLVLGAADAVTFNAVP